MEILSALLALCAGNSPVTGEFPLQRPVTRSFDVLFDLRLNKRLSKQSWGWWFETPSCPVGSCPICSSHGGCMILAMTYHIETYMYRRTSDSQMAKLNTNHTKLWIQISLWRLTCIVNIIIHTHNSHYKHTSIPNALPMMTSSTGKFSALLALCAGNSPVTGKFPSQRPVTRSFDLFDLRLNKRLSKQSSGWWFEMPSRSLWRHCYAYKCHHTASPMYEYA